MRIFLRLADPAGPTEWPSSSDGAPGIPIPLSARDCIADDCPRCGRPHDRLWTIRRRATAWGHWPVVTINGESAVIDGSLPHVVARLPRDASPIAPADAAGFWHDDNESHTFGGPNVAAALRTAVARVNGR